MRAVASRRAATRHGAVGSPPGREILEVGVGTGYGVNDYPRGCEVIAIDLSRAMIERAARRVDDGHRSMIAFAQMDAGDLALPIRPSTQFTSPTRLTLCPTQWQWEENCYAYARRLVASCSSITSTACRRRPI